MCTAMTLATGNQARNIRNIQALLIILTIPRCEIGAAHRPHS